MVSFKVKNSIKLPPTQLALNMASIVAASTKNTKSMKVMSKLKVMSKPKSKTTAKIASKSKPKIATKIKAIVMSKTNAKLTTKPEAAVKPKAKAMGMPNKVAKTMKEAFSRRKVAKPIKSMKSPTKKERKMTT